MNHPVLHRQPDDLPFRQDPKQSFTLPARFYTDTAIFEAEKTAIFYRTWHYTGHVSQVAEPGMFLTTRIHQQNVFVARGRDGALRAFFNVCAHRGHELLEGTGKKNVITCPYHAWAYDFDGRLVNARNSENVAGFDKCDFSLKPVRVEVFCGLVMINLDPDATPFAQQMAGLEDEIRQYLPRVDELAFAQRDTFHVQSNWKVLVDNFLECYHCAPAHKDFVDLVAMDTYKVTTHGIYSSHMAEAGKQSNSAYAVDNATVKDHAVWWLWPNTCIMRYPGRGNMIIMHIVPVGHDRTFETYDFFFEDDTPNPAEQDAIRYIDEVLQVEDIGLVESVQRGMSTPAFTQGRIVHDPAGSGKSEHAVHHFHGLVLDAYARAAG